MQKKLFGNILLLLAINVLIKPVWILIIDRGVQNRLGYEAYGDYVSMFGIAMILTMLLDFGINNYNSSNIAQYPDRLGQQFSELLSLKLLLSGVYLILTFLLAHFYGFSSLSMLGIMVLAFNQVVAHFSTFFRSTISGLQLFKTDSILSAVDRFTMILLGAVMLAGDYIETGISNFILIQTIGYLTVFMLSWIIIWPKIKRIQIRFNKSLLIEIITKTYPYAVLAFVMLMYTRLDVLLIKKIAANGDFENGVFASGGRLLEAATMMVGATTAILLPVFAKLIAQKQNLSSIVDSLYAFFVLPVIVFAACCSVFSKEVMHLLSPGSDAYVANVFAVLILAFIPYTFMYIFGSMLTAQAKMKVLITICGVALLVNILANVVLIPRLGALGAAYAVLLTQSIVGIGKWFAAIKFTGLHVKMNWFIQLILLPFILVLGGSYLKMNGLSMVLTIGSMLLFTFLLAMLSGMLSAKHFKALRFHLLNK